MKIGILSDTRIPSVASEVPQEVARAFEGVDMILHAGGIQATKVLDWLEQIAPVKAVGRIPGFQMESSSPYGLESMGDNRIADQQVLQLEGYTIGMVNSLDLHSLSDDVMPGIIAAKNFPQGTITNNVKSVFGADVNIVVFGRTLEAMIEEHDGVLFVNPGSPTLPKNYMRLGQVAILNLSQDSRQAEIVELNTFS